MITILHFAFLIDCDPGHVGVPCIIWLDVTRDVDVFAVLLLRDLVAVVVSDATVPIIPVDDDEGENAV